MSRGTGGISARRLRQAEPDDTLDATNLPDPRAREVAALVTVDEGVLNAIREVFTGTGLADDPTKVRALLQARSSVAEAWRDARNSYIECGRALLAVDRQLTATEQDALKRGFARLFPFSETIASQFRQIARAVDEGRLPLDVCPGSYSTAYQLALLTPGQMELARSRGLLRANVSRHAVLAFRREVRGVTGTPRQEIDFSRLRGEARRLEAERRRQLEALLATRRRLREICALLRGSEEG
jgi:hypothetical protein